MTGADCAHLPAAPPPARETRNQFLDGQMVEAPAETLLPLAQRFLETNGEPLPGQVGAE
jgi:hypothetical protein